MKKNYTKLMRLCLITTFLILTLPHILSAGVKGKIQQRLNAPNTLQYEPFYLEQEQSTSQTKPERPSEGRRKTKRRISNAIQPTEAPVLSRYAIYRTDYKAELEENVVTVKGKAIFQVFKEGWTQLPLISSDVGLIDVSVNRGVAFVTMQGNKYYLMIDKPGKYTLNIEFLIKASRELNQQLK